MNNKKFRHIVIEQRGYVWWFPSHIVADDRANHYVETYSDRDYQKEYDFAITNEDELCDWFINCMDLTGHMQNLELMIKPRNPGVFDLEDDFELSATTGV